jgi:Flp pilus assembly pilin Flp
MGPLSGGPSLIQRYRLKTLLKRFICEDSGQDLVEYGLLAATIAAAGAAVLPGIATKMGQLFSTWGNDVYGAWVPNDPL